MITNVLPPFYGSQCISLLCCAVSAFLLGLRAAVMPPSKVYQILISLARQIDSDISPILLLIFTEGVIKSVEFGLGFRSKSPLGGPRLKTEQYYRKSSILFGNHSDWPTLSPNLI